MKKAKKVLKVISIFFIIIMLLGVVGSISQHVLTRSELKKNPAPGTMVKVFDTKLHVFSTGESNGKPVLLLFSGLGTPYPTADFYPIWNRLCKDYQVVVVERPGYGYSEKTDRKRTVKNIVEEYRTALDEAGINPPYVIAAHSLAGLEAQYFASIYNEEVAGVILMECNSPQMYLKYQSGVPVTNRLFAGVRSVGGMRLLDRIAPSVIEGMSYGIRNDFEYVSTDYKKADRMIAKQRYMNKMVLGETALKHENAEIVSELSFSKSLPVVLIMEDKEEYHDYPGYEEQMKMQKDWVSQSKEGRVLLLEGGHYIHQYDPDGVCAAIQEVYKDVVTP